MIGSKNDAVLRVPVSAPATHRDRRAPAESRRLNRRGRTYPNLLTLGKQAGWS